MTADTYLEIMDSPGLMWPKVSEERVGIIIAALGSIKEEILDTERLSIKLIELLSVRAPKALEERYGVAYDGNALAALEGICRRRGFLIKGGECDYERGAKTLLDEFQTGKLGRITLEAPDERT